jgi:hypothetical protein
MLEPEQASVTISYNQNESRNEEDSEIRSNIIEGQIRLGISDKLEAGIKYGLHSCSWQFKEEEKETEIGDINFNFTSLDAKFSILPNHIAFSIPLGFFWTANDEENDEMEEFLFQLQPGFIFSYQYQPFEITGAVKYLIFTEEDDKGFDKLLALILGWVSVIILVGGLLVLRLDFSSIQKRLMKVISSNMASEYLLD